MKKRVAAFVITLLTLWLAACTGDHSNARQTMVISESSFSEETQEVLKILDDELIFFDYRVDDTVKSASVGLWMYENGTWVSQGQVIGDLNAKDCRIAVRINENSCDIFHVEESGHTKSHYVCAADFSGSKLVANTRLASPTPIQLNQEIALWVRLGTDQNTMAAGNAQNFREAACNAGIAVTITFSNQEVG